MRSGALSAAKPEPLSGLNPFFIRECVLAYGSAHTHLFISLNPFFIRECVLAISLFVSHLMPVLIPSLSGNAFWRSTGGYRSTSAGLNPFFIRECVLAAKWLGLQLVEGLNPFFIRECVLADRLFDCGGA